MGNEKTSRADAILDAAERRIRRGGFTAASFRDLAEDVGIKSASVHYHFPQKSDLGRALVERYGKRMMESLGPADDLADTPSIRLSRLIQSYRASLDTDGAACLCAILGSAVHDLPDPVGSSVRNFYARLTAWAKTALGDQDTAEYAISVLQGAMIFTVATGNPKTMEHACNRLKATLLRE